MLKKIICERCGEESLKFYYCDQCGEELVAGIPFEIDCGFGSHLEGNDYHFCSIKCLTTFVLAENKKFNKQTNTLYGI